MIAGFVVAAVLLRRVPRTPPDAPVVPIILWTAIGILVNAAVCGILSGPHDRYSARVAWLLPFAALLIFVRQRKILAQTPSASVESARTPAV